MDDETIYCSRAIGCKTYEEKVCSGEINMAAISELNTKGYVFVYSTRDSVPEQLRGRPKGRCDRTEELSQLAMIASPLRALAEETETRSREQGRQTT